MENEYNLICYLPFNSSPIEDLCGNTWVGSTGSNEKIPSITDAPKNSNKPEFLKAMVCTFSTVVRCYIKNISTIYIGGQDFTLSYWFYISGHNKENFPNLTVVNETNENIFSVSFSSKNDGTVSNLYSAILISSKFGKSYKPSQSSWHRILCYYKHSTGTWNIYIDGDLFLTSKFALDKQIVTIKLGNVDGGIYNQPTIHLYIKDFYILDGLSENLPTTIPPINKPDPNIVNIPFEMIAIIDELPALSGGNTIILYPIVDMELSEYWCSGSYIGRGGVKYNLSCTTGKVEIVNNIGNCLYNALKSDNQDSSIINFIYSGGSQPQFGTLEFWTYIDFNEENTIFKLTGNSIGETNYESITINLGNSSYKIIPIFEGENIDSYIKTESISSINKKWTHIAISFTGSYIEIFIDGKKKFQIEIMCFSSILNIISFYLWNKNNSINYINNIRFCDFIRYSEDFEITLPTSAYNINENENIKPINQEENIPDEEEDNQEEEEKEKDGDE